MNLSWVRIPVWERQILKSIHSDDCEWKPWQSLGSDGGGGDGDVEARRKKVTIHSFLWVL